MSGKTCTPFAAMLQKQVASFCRPFYRTLTRARLGGGGGTDTPFFYQDEYVPLNRVLFSGSRALNRVYNFTSVLTEGFFLDRRPLNDERSILVVHIPKNVSRKILFSDVSLENYFTVFVERIETGS